MSEYLPYGEFRWVKNIDELDVVSVNKESDIGYLLEVNLDYPDELHELHNDYPLAHIKVGDVKKLISNLGNKTKYVLHYKNLQLYSSLAMKLTKIHRVLQFKQSYWMKRYIDFNTEKRKKCCQ